MTQETTIFSRHVWCMVATECNLGVLGRIIYAAGCMEGSCLPRTLMPAPSFDNKKYYDRPFESLLYYFRLHLLAHQPK
jgi:hypothetical protein